MQNDLQPKELVYCGGSQRIGVIEGFAFTDYQECNLWELTDGKGAYWLCPEYLIYRLPDNWKEMSAKAREIVGMRVL